MCSLAQSSLRRKLASDEPAPAARSRARRSSRAFLLILYAGGPMADEKTEKTPKGLEVPVPKRATFFDNLKKVAKPDKDSAPGGSKK
jgi:hypothetical protein